MTDEKSSGTPPSGGMAVLNRLVRISIFFLTAGFIYPNVWVENIDNAKLDAEHKINANKL